MTGRGRPPKAGREGLPRRILDEALALLDDGGPEGLTLRRLAVRLGLTPMALYHHHADRAALIRALAERAYAHVDAPAAGQPRDRIAGLIAAYHGAVQRHPALTLEIFRDPAAFPDEAGRITATLERLLQAAGLDAPAALAWRDILIDFAHGSALALAARGCGSEAAAQGGAAEALHHLLAALPLPE
jgi:AcrR family transcriptional regulator